MADPEVMWDWLRAYGVPFYDTFWWVNGIEEYKKIYGRSYAEELRTRGISPEDPAFKAVLDEQRQKASYHFGDPHLNIATLAGIIRMALKAYDAAPGLETERNVTPISTGMDSGRENKGIPRPNKTAESRHDRDAALPRHPAAWIFAACTENSCQIPAEGV